MARLDPHSYTDSDQARTESLEWSARVDFDSRVLHAQAILNLRDPAGGILDLDTRDLEIEDVSDQGGRPVSFALEAPERILGSRLRLQLPEKTQSIRIRYRTSPSASALQWLDAEQTFGKAEPFLFSQCQAIHARSLIPLQDTPRVRIRYRAEFTVPARLRGLMAGRFLSRHENGTVAVERYEGPEPIPPYLFALAVGKLSSRDLGPRSRVWAEAAIVESAAWEFARVEETMRAAEVLFGPYLWERFDILTMPLSFPYGGMENPRLTFITPTVLAGDRSLVNVVAHELAHSWTGNLVSNASAEHFWLNEGFTVYAERRILEVLEGEEMAALHAAVGRRSLDDALERFASRPELTRLRTQLQGVDPDEAFSVVPYEKGYLFLRAIEESVGRSAFDAFLRKYLTQFRFQSITTEEFVRALEEHLPQVRSSLNVGEWLTGTGVPANAPVPRSGRVEAIAAVGQSCPSPAAAKSWTPSEWQLYLESLHRPASLELSEQLDSTFHLGQSKNYEVLISWLVVAAHAKYSPAFRDIERVLGEVGRMKYLRPLYTALSKSSQTRGLSEACYARYRGIYHPIARQVVETILRASPAT